MRDDGTRSLVILSDLTDRLRALGPDWEWRANEVLRDWLEKRPEVVALSSPFSARMLTKKQTADYCCAGSLARLDRWRRSGMIPNPPPGTNLFDRHAIDAALDKLSGIEAKPSTPEAKTDGFIEEWRRKRDERRARERAERDDLAGPSARGRSKKASI